MVCDGPKLVYWELTSGCNLRCIHCRTSAADLSHPVDLSYRECCAAIDQLVEFAPLELVLGGGEPLWRKDVFAIADYAAKRGLLVRLSTNGTLVDEAMAHRIREAGVRQVAITLDGADRATHDTFRGHNGAFDAAVYGLKCLKELGVSTQINATVAQHNIHQLPKLLALAGSLGVDAFHLYLLVPVNCGLAIPEDEAVDGEEAEQILNWVLDRSLDSGMELSATCAPQYSRIAAQHQAGAKKTGTERSAPASGRPTGRLRTPQSTVRGCQAGSGTCFLSRRGDVFPCGHLPVSAGNLRRERFRDIWEHAAVFTDLRNSENLQGHCGLCEFRDLCRGCRARAYGVTGNYLAEQPHCIYQPKTMRGEHCHP